MTTAAKVYLSDEAMDAVNRVAGGVGNVNASISRRLNAMATAYDEIVAESVPAFSVEEWMTVVRCCRHTARESPSLLVSHLGLLVDDAERAKICPGVDRSKLVDRLRRLSAAERFAVCEVVFRCEALDAFGEIESARAWLVEVGAAIGQKLYKGE